jgi:hypothetical protein
MAGAGVVAGLWAGALGVLGMNLLVLPAWAVTPGDADAASAVRAALDGWLLAHHATLLVPGGQVGLVPLGLTMGLAALLAVAGARAARAAGPAPWQSRVVLTLSASATYGLLPLLVAPLAANELVRPVASQAAGGAFLLALVSTGVGAGMGSGRFALVRASAAPTVRASVRALLVALAVLTAGGALLVAGSLVAHHDAVARLAGSLRPGVLDGVALLILCALLLPNAVIWAIAYLVGPGFAVGVGTSVTPLSAHLGAVPALPLLGALPAGPAPPWVLLLVLSTPLAAGALAGLVCVRSLDPAAPAGAGGGRPGEWSERQRVLTALTVGLVGGLVLAGLAAVSGGALGGGRLMVLGPSPWQVGLLAAVELGLSAAVTAWAVPPRRVA